MPRTFDLQLEDLPIATVIGSHRVMRDCNEAYCKLYGYERHQLIGQSFRLIYLDNPEFRRNGLMWKKHLNAKTDYVDERIMRRADGSLFWCQVRGRGLRADNPMALAIFFVLPIARPVQLKGPELTQRQRQIVALVSQGKTNQEIGSEVGVSVRTAEAHRLRIMRKIGLRNTAELVAWFHDNEGRARGTTPLRSV